MSSNLLFPCKFTSHLKRNANSKIGDSESRLNVLRREILDKSKASLSATSAFQSHYHDLTAQINNSWTANYARHEGLKHLELLDMKRRDLLRAKSYIQILLHVYDLRLTYLKSCLMAARKLGRKLAVIPKRL
jgi:hypothetical protein